MSWNGWERDEIDRLTARVAALEKIVKPEVDPPTADRLAVQAGEWFGRDETVREKVEADTAKETWVLRSFKPHNPPAADRLAQTVTDVRLTAGEAEQYRSTAEMYLKQGQPRHMMMLAEVVWELCVIAEAALRARESAPAQEVIGSVSEYAGKTMNGKPIYALIADKELPVGTKVYAAAPRAGS